MDVLYREARSAQPPPEHRSFPPPDLVDVRSLIPEVQLDVRYASTNNFLRTRLYEASLVFLQRPVAHALARTAEELYHEGYGLLLYDGYRPWYVTKWIWEATPPAYRSYLADPAQGSRHNRGCAIDLTLYHRGDGRPAAMPTDFDDFSERAHADYQSLPAAVRANRDRLRHAMEQQNFRIHPKEWWHFDFIPCLESYPLLNIPLNQLGNRQRSTPD